MGTEGFVSSSVRWGQYQPLYPARTPRPSPRGRLLLKPLNRKCAFGGSISLMRHHFQIPAYHCHSQASPCISRSGPGEEQWVRRRGPPAAPSTTPGSPKDTRGLRDGMPPPSQPPELEGSPAFLTQGPVGGGRKDCPNRTEIHRTVAKILARPTSPQQGRPSQGPSPSDSPPGPTGGPKPPGVSKG